MTELGAPNATQSVPFSRTTCKGAVFVLTVSLIGLDDLILTAEDVVVAPFIDRRLAACHVEKAVSPNRMKVQVSLSLSVRLSLSLFETGKRHVLLSLLVVVYRGGEAKIVSVEQ